MDTQPGTPSGIDPSTLVPTPTSQPSTAPKPHRWIIQGVWFFSKEEAGMLTSSDQIILKRNPDQVVGPGCYDCEQHYIDAKDTSCQSPRMP